jgi:hypothetical protein
MRPNLIVRVAALLGALAACGCPEKPTAPGPAGAAAAPVLAPVNVAEPEVAAYLTVTSALAADKFDPDVKKTAAKLRTSADPETAKAAGAVEAAPDIAAARKAFGDLSKAVIARVEAKKLAPGATLYEIECPMAKPYGRWLSATDQVLNPYWGKQMLTCGEKVATLAPEPKK